MPVRKRKTTDAKSGAKEEKSDTSGRKVKRGDKGDKNKAEAEKPTLRGRVFTFLKYALLVLIFPPIVNYGALQQETNHFTKNATMYDVGFGQRLHLNCRGEGLPTVILDAPTGMASNAWSPLHDILAQHTKVCAYDRAGLGLSDKPIRNGTINDKNQQIIQRSQEFTVERMADDLHRLISEVSEQPRPLLLVGAEVGGLVATFFTQLHHSEVCGLVLVNPMSAAMITQDDTGAFRKYWTEQLIASLQMKQLGAALGYNRLALKTGLLKLPFGAAFKDELALGQQHHYMCHPKHLSAAVEEHFFANVSLQQMQTVLRLKPFPEDVAIKVITGASYDSTLPSAVNKAWSRALEEVLQKLLTAEHVTLQGANKLIYRKPRLLASHVMKLVEVCKSRIVEPSPGPKAS